MNCLGPNTLPWATPQSRWWELEWDELCIMWHQERSLIHSDQIKKDLIEIDLILLFLCTVYERRPLTLYCAQCDACCWLLLVSSTVTMETPYYVGFWFLIKKLQKLSRWNSLLSPSGPINALWPNFRPIGSKHSEKITEKKNKMKKPTRGKTYTLAAATLR